MWKGDTYNLGPVWGKEKGKGEKENRNRGICRIRKKKKGQKNDLHTKC